MNWFILAIPTLFGALYHIGQKKLRVDASPFLLFTLIYLVSMGLMLLCYFFLGDKGISFKSFNFQDWKSIFLVSLGIIGIELGFLLAYREGLPLNTSALLVNTAMGIILLVFGVWAEGEKVSLQQLAGILFSFVGLFLITFKG